MRRIYSIILLLFFFGGFSLAQNKQENNSEKLIQLSGVLVSADSLNQVSYASVANKTTQNGTLSDFYGFFSIVTRPGDTLLFNGIGFKLGSYIVPDTLTQTNYSIIHVMVPDTITLKQVNIQPWPSREDFARAFVDMHPYHDAIRRVQQNLSKERLASIAATLPTNSGISYKWEANQRQTQLYTKGEAPVNNLLNPISWVQFINAWKNGDLRRKSEKHSRAYRY